MDIGRALRDSRRRAGLTQTELGNRTGTSQATISAYENAHKVPSVETLARLLSAAGSRLTVQTGRQPVVRPSARQHARVARDLRQVLELAAALPSRPSRELGYPRLRSGSA